MVPPSLHYTGAPLEWTAEGEPAEVKRTALQRAAFRLALACELKRTGSPRAQAVELAQAEPIPWAVRPLWTNHCSRLRPFRKLAFARNLKRAAASGRATAS